MEMNTSMVFGDYFDSVFNDRRGESTDKIAISKKKYEKLLEMAEKYKALSSEVETLRLDNRKLSDVLKDLKEDGRDFKELQEEKEKYYRALVRAQADLENYKKRTDRDRHSYRMRALEGILRKLISHYDDLLRARDVIEALEDGEKVQQGFAMIIKNFEKLLAEEGVKPMEAIGKEFDPYKHEAAYTMEREDLPEHTIIEEVERGYLFNNDVLRPAKVVISKK